MNGRIASQFAPLVEAVEGRSTYEALFALAAGDTRVGASAPRTASRSPTRSVCSRTPSSRRSRRPSPDVELLVQPGSRLSEQGVNDVASYRLAIFDAWGDDAGRGGRSGGGAGG